MYRNKRILRLLRRFFSFSRQDVRWNFNNSIILINLIRYGRKAYNIQAWWALEIRVPRIFDQLHHLSPVKLMLFNYYSHPNSYLTETSFSPLTISVLLFFSFNILSFVLVNDLVRKIEIYGWSKTNKAQKWIILINRIDLFLKKKLKTTLGLICALS